LSNVAAHWAMSLSTKKRTLAVPMETLPFVAVRRVSALAIVLLTLPHCTLADLPVHCLRHQVVGDWEFILALPRPERSSCGHHLPDNPEQQPALKFLQDNGPTTSIHLSLKDPSTVVAENGGTGTWTMIYDEAFEVSLEGTVFLAFSNFEYVQDAELGRTNVSHCDATQIGWYHDAARTRWGCYLGLKKGSKVKLPPTAAPSTAAPVAQPAQLALVRQQVDPAGGRPPSVPQADWDSMSDDERDEVRLEALREQHEAGSSGDAARGPEQLSLAEMNGQGFGPGDGPSDQSDDENTDEDDTQAYPPGGWVPASAGYDEPMPHHWQRTVARALNFLQLGWTAVAYDFFQGKTPRQLNRFAGVKHSRPEPQGGFRSKARAAAASHVAFSSFLGVRSQVRRTSGSSAFDWRHQHGQDWLTPVVAQGDCGSCYTISTVHMLTARHRIARKNASQAPFSVLFPLYCSEYNQGCDGGYGFLQSKWSEDVGLVPEHCAPFSDANGACDSLGLSKCSMGSTRFRAANHRYVGGFYGASEEKTIRAELVKNGPVVMSFEPKEDFMYYKNGVYKSGPNKIHQEWEQVDHAVLLIGYGEENSQAYWTLQNSWGSDWGEDGYFRMARGIDESGCESIVVAAEVIEEHANPVLDNFIKGL